MRATAGADGWPRATAPPFTFIFSGLKLELARYADSGYGKRFVEFNEIDVLCRDPNRFFVSNFSTASTGAIITHLGSTPLTACATIRAIGDFPRRNAFRSLVTIKAAAPSLVPGALPAVTVPSFLKAGFNFASASMLVSSRGDSSYLITMGSPFFWGTSMGRILRFEETRFAGTHSFLVAFDSELVLLLARDAVFFGDQFSGHAHMKIFVCIPESVVNHGIDDFSVADAKASARLRQQIRAVGHRLHPAGNDNFGFAKLDGLCRKRDGFQAGAADFVDGHGGNARGAAAFEGGLACWILAEARCTTLPRMASSI